jgi:ABC-type multidrug transport system fused ATPase/permease subunit
MELTLIFGALIVSGVQFVLNDATRAIANLVVFLAAATRIAPAILRIQQSLLILRGGLGTVDNTIKIIKEASVGEYQDLQDNTPDFKHLDFNSSIVIKNLKFAYGESNQFQLSKIDLFVAQGEHIAISGSSGAGKTTLVDLILGVLTPTKGSIEISGVNPLQAFKQWPGATAYVPQDIVIVNGTIWENIALGFSFDQNHEYHIWDALKLAHLDDYVRNLPEGLFTQVGERGYKLSGGQRQRLGIARALYTKPKILVMDEATSALDGETESDIANAIKSLRGKTTVLIIAHRLSSVRNADQVIFMSNGTIIAKGTFTQVRDIAPEFDRQANLMGL